MRASTASNFRLATNLMLSFSILSQETGYNLLNFQSNNTGIIFVKLQCCIANKMFSTLPFSTYMGLLKFEYSSAVFFLKTHCLLDPLNLGTPRLAENVISLFKNQINKIFYLFAYKLKRVGSSFLCISFLS